MKKQLDSLITENEKLKEEVEALKDENKLLWFMIEEHKSSQTSMGQALETLIQERLQDEIIKSLKPVGDA